MSAIHCRLLRSCLSHGSHLARQSVASFTYRSVHQTPLKQSTKMAAGFNYQDAELQRFMDDMHKLIMNDVFKEGSNIENKMVDFEQPKDLENMLDLDIPSSGTDHPSLLKLCRQVIKHSVKTVHPGFHNQLYGTANGYGVSGAWLTEALNTNIHTYETNPSFVLIENYMVKKICGVIGYKTGDGLFCPGGSFSNIMAINMARYRKFPEFKTRGLFDSRKLKVYTSAEAHYSLTKGAIFLGLGSDNVVKVKTDLKGKMIPEELEKCVQQDLENNEVPFFVNATSGTTVLGAYDPLPQLSDVCLKHDLWLHVDACWGGAALMSDKYKHLMTGIDRVDSVAWNFHKMMGTPIQCSALLVKQPGLLEEVNCINAEYLFQPDKCYDTSYDIGDKTIQCGRKVDSMKLWLMWKALGDQGMAQHVDNAFDNARYLTEQLAKTDGFELVLPEYECPTVSFWYIPPSLRGQPRTDEWWTKVSKVAPKIKERMMMSGSLMIGYQPLTVRGLVNFFRIVVANGNNTHSDMDYVLKEIDRLGNDL